jgi:hypothetical protein
MIIRLNFSFLMKRSIVKLNNLETLFNKTNNELIGSYLYIYNLVSNGFTDKTVFSVHEKVVSIENILQAYLQLQMSSKDTIVKEWINKRVLKTEIMLEIAKLVEDLIVSNNYIQSNETCKLSLGKGTSDIARSDSSFPSRPKS